MRLAPPSNASAGLTMAASPYCPQCGCFKPYKVASRHVWKCSGCAHQFSVTSGTIFADRKRPLRDHLLAIAIFTNGAKGHSALQLSRDLCCTYKSAFVLAHKLREAIEVNQQATEFAPETEKEIDGAYFGGGQKQTNEVANRVDRRLAEEQTGKRQVVVVIRERYGRTLPFVFGKESDAVATIRAKIPMGSTVHADEARGWDALHQPSEVFPDLRRRREADLLALFGFSFVGHTQCQI